MSSNREPLAALASLALSMIAFIASAFVLWCREETDFATFVMWLFLAVFCLGIVYVFYKNLRMRLMAELAKENQEA